jgi:hypothetical protein
MCVVRVRIVGNTNQGLCAGAIDSRAAYGHIERPDHICEIPEERRGGTRRQSAAIRYRGIKKKRVKQAVRMLNKAVTM